MGTGAIEQYAEFVPEGSKPGAMQKLYKGGTSISGGSNGEDAMRYAFGAEFVEVRVHRLTREIRVPRAVGAFAAGRIVNPRTAHSQLMGGMIWGISSALHEETEIDTRFARYTNTNLADYLVPVNADVPQIDVILLSEKDRRSIRSASRASGSLVTSAPRRPWQMPCITPPDSGPQSSDPVREGDRVIGY